MDTTGEHEAAATRAQRPKPPRPDVSVAPLHDTCADPGRTPPTVTAAVTAWAASFATFAALAAVLAADYDTVVDALSSGLTTRDPTANPDTADQAAGLTVLGVGAVGMLLVLAAVLGIVWLRSGHGRARGWLTAVGALTVVAAVGMWSVLSDAGDVAFGLLTWAPLLQAALVAVGTALLFTSAASAWLGRRIAVSL
ncbi:membrane protein [Prescottella defluvii]|uniref:membrane protein n=1 Tax=Prescottella defluvii TaxID=1323361 RepID=UPI0004F27B54|nr:membrane protein [Prescottella defluvii]